MGKRLAALLGLVVAIVLLAAGCRQAKSYRAQSYDVTIAVQENGAAVITETVSFAFQGGPFTYAFREIPLDKTGGVDRVAVSEGSQVYTVGTGLGQYDLRTSGDTLKVTWHFPPSENIRRTFTLSYRVLGLIRQEGGQDALRWGALPSQHDYGITRAGVSIQLPGKVGPVTGARVLDGAADIGRSGSRITFQAADVEADQALVVGVWFPHGQLSGVPPAWQTQQLAQAGRSPLWIVAAALALLVGLGLLVWAERKWGRERAQAPSNLAEILHAGSLPLQQGGESPLAPGLAGALVHNGGRATDILATLFDLAGRGVVLAEEIETTGGRRPRRQFGLVQLWQPDAASTLSAPEGLPAFEAATLISAFSRAREGRVSLKDAAAGLLAGSGAVTKQLNDALYERGLLGRKRDRIRRTFMIVGAGLMVLALASTAAPILWGRLFGLWPLLVTAALFLVGFAWLLGGVFVSRRTQAGEQAAAEWQAFRRSLRQMARERKKPMDPALLERYFPYAVALGLAQPWSKQMAAAGAPVPAWFRALSQEAEAKSEMVAFVALIAAISAGIVGSQGGVAPAA